MTGRERLIRTLRGEATDRVPVAPFVHSSTVTAWRNDPKADVIADTIAFCKHYGFDIIHRNFAVRHSDFGMSTDDWIVEENRVVHGNVATNNVRVTTPGGVLTRSETYTNLSPYLTVSAQAEPLIKNAEDFALLKRYIPVPVAPNLADLLRAKALLGDDGITAPWVWGVFNYMATFRSLQDLLTDPYDDPDFYEEFAAFALDRLHQAMLPLWDAGVDMLSYTGNLANGTMVGPAYFEANVLPFEKKLTDWIQAHCLGIIYHNCGDADHMIPCYNRLRPVCYESMTEPPYANNSLEKSLEEFDPSIALMGNIDQIRFLKDADASEVSERAKRILRLTKKRGRFLLGTSDFLEEGTPEANLFALAQSVL